MKKIKIESEFEAYDDLKDLPQDIQDLMRAAFEARDAAYAQYSKFHVGAAIQLESGIVVKGSNQENAAYPSGLCAERVALFYAGARFPDVKIKTIAVSVMSKNFKVTDVISPCGACRQVMAEYEDKQEQAIKVILHSPTDQVLIANTVESLLPFMFKSPLLKQH